MKLNSNYGVFRCLLNMRNKKVYGAHTNFGIQFLVLVELDSLNIGGNPISDCLSNQNNTFVPFMPSLTFFYFQDYHL